VENFGDMCRVEKGLLKAMLQVDRRDHVCKESVMEILNSKCNSDFNLDQPKSKTTKKSSQK
jgi:hypothetical protein